MRSERDIKRAPKRPRATAPTDNTAPGSAAPAAPPTRVHDKVSVSYAPPSDRGPRGPRDDRPPRPEAARGWANRPDDGGRSDPRRRDEGPWNNDRPRRPGLDRRDAGPAAGPGRSRDGARGAPPGTRPPYRQEGPEGPDRRHAAAERPQRPQRPPQPGVPPQRPDRQAFVRQTPPQPVARDTPPAGAEGRAPRHDGSPAPVGPQRVRRDEIRPGSIAAEQGFRLSKVLTDRGTASRREADDWIAAGWVKVDGQMAVLGQRVLPDARIEIDPAARTQQARQVTILLNKPIGYVSGQAEDGYEPASVLVTAANRWEDDPHRLPFQPGHARGLAPAGRLDIDSTGLLVLTQNGRVAKLLIGEDSDIEKEYLVRVEYTLPGPFPEADLKRLNHGLMLDEKVLKPAKVSWANEDQLRFVLREGRKRQIRRMCELVGLKVTALKRVRIGSVVLGKLPPGQWRYLRDDERF